MKADISYLQAKLEDIHADVKLLKEHVDLLRTEHHGRKAVTKFVIACLAVLGTTVGWLVDNAIAVAAKVEIADKKGATDGSI